MKKKILIHAVGATLGGGLRHTSCLISALAKLDPDRHYDVLVRDWLPIKAPGGNVNLIRIPNEKSNGWISRVIFDTISIPIMVKRNGYSGVISLMNFGPIILGVPHIFYQCNVLYFSKIGLSLATRKDKVLILARRFLASASMRYATAIVTPSRSTEMKIRKLYPSIPVERFYVLPHGVDKDGYEQPLESQLHLRVEAAIGYKIFYPAHLHRHKSFDMLISISSLLKNRMEFTLFLTIERAEGSNDYDDFIRKISDNQLLPHIVILGNIPQQQMGSMYKACDLMLFPSLLESFGLPLIEAMTYNCPIVASDTAINRETCGNAALLFSPLNAEDAVEKIEESLNPAVRSRLIEEGIHRLRERDWSWNGNASALTKILDNLEI